MTRPHHTIMSMAKDEGPRLLEWVAYHRLIGFDAIWVYTNDCRDGTDAMLDRLEAMGLVHHRKNVVPEGKKPQPHALTLAQKNAQLCDTDWLIALDTDEFVHVTTGDGSISALLAACPTGTEGVALNWRMMGSNGHVAWSDAPILTQFTRGAPPGFRRGWGVKTLFRPFPDMRLGIHRPTVKGARKSDAARARLRAMAWVNGDGQPMPPSFLDSGWRGSAATVGYGLGQIAHFAVQSQEAYLLRGERGNVNLKPDKYDATYFAMFDRNEAPIPGLAARSAEVQSSVDAWLQDARLKALHEAAIAWHRSRLQDLKATAPGAARLRDLQAAAEVGYDDLAGLLFTQPLPPASKTMVAAMQARGIPDATIAAQIAATVAKLEAKRDAREAAELREMGISPKA